MLSYLRPAAVLLLAFTLLTGLAYPFAVTGIAQLLFSSKANGSLIERDGTVVGSQLIGQAFSSNRYFHGRPSATTAPGAVDKMTGETLAAVPAPYNAAASGASNAGPTSSALLERIRRAYAKLRSENAHVPVPVDLVTSSASGLDPHITPAAAEFQVPRVARARHMTEEQIRALVAANTTQRWIGLFGEPVVNVLQLNLALDAAASAASPH